MSYIRLSKTIIKKEKIIEISIKDETGDWFGNDLRPYLLYITYAKIYQKDSNVYTHVIIECRYKTIQLLMEDLSKLLVGKIEFPINNKIKELDESILKIISQKIDLKID